MTSPTQDARRSAPAVARNRDPILSVLQRALPGRGLVLEIASGTGEHAVHFAAALPHLEWQPTDRTPESLASIDAWAAAAAVPTVRPALHLDVTDHPWPVAEAAAVVCINMIHIAPPAATDGLLRGAAAVLPAGAPLVLYGPFKVGGFHTADSNMAFEAWLKDQNPEFGVRNLEDVADLAAVAGFAAPETVQMPANNLTVVFRRR
ncbi:DUF938 domain-containing protein [Caenispirillum bisanense]|uniref:DUF938 domain-containing protein n=1 Tax=Caenispirillum bisanense TaxID=414052 RepID=UPI0031DE3FE6